MQLKQRYDGLLENAKEESKQIVEESRTRAGKEYEERVQKAERQANRILEKAKQDVENEREQAMEAMQKQIAGVAMAAAGKILKEQADSSVDRSIYDQYIAGIGESHEAEDAVETAKQLYLQSEELRKVLNSPIVTRAQKHRIIDKLFPQEMHSFLKKVCDYNEAEILPDIFSAYEIWRRESQGILVGTLYYMTEPTKAQLRNIEQGLCKKLGCQQLQLTLEEDHSLIGGFVIRIGDLEIDQSILGSVNGLKQKLTRR